MDDRRLGVATRAIRAVRFVACVAGAGWIGPGFVASVVAAAVPALPAPLAAQSPAGSADVVVTVSGPGMAGVEARYVVAPAPAQVVLRAMPGRCVEILDATLERDGSTTPVTLEPDGPWVDLRDGPPPAGSADSMRATALEASGAAGSDTLRATVRYAVRWSGSSARVPLPVLGTPVPQEDGEREGTVHLQVRFPDGGGHVVLPHMTRAVANEWSARTVAVPSFVEVDLGRAAAGGGPGGAETPAAPEAAAASPGCPEAASPPPPDGGLVWRFWLLVGIMGAWVPLYLAWARRGEGDEA